MMGILLVCIALIFSVFHYWFRNYAANALADIVHKQSKGKLRLNIGDFSFNWLNNKIELDSSVILGIDPNDPVLYQVVTDRIAIKARGFLPFLFHKEVLIDSIRLYNPKIVFTRLRKSIEKVKAPNDSVHILEKHEKYSVAEELGRITMSISDAISFLRIDALRFDNGSFSMVDKTKPDDLPFTVNNVFIELDSLQLDTTKFQEGSSRNTINFTDNIAIRTSNQNIHFPGGRHSLSFKNFRMNLKSRRVEFDSCILQGRKADSASASFRIVFDKLALTSINFDSLYNNETIIADSVFCNNPIIHLIVDGDQPLAMDKQNKPKIQKVDDLVQQLLGDLRLRYVGVKNAAITVNTVKKGRANIFSSSQSNFEIYDLVVRQDEQRPVNLSRFQMALHHSDNLLRNGQYAISFDSIGFANDYIRLSRFSFREYKNGIAQKTLSMPVFQVNNISWEALLYDNVFVAERALFFKPEVDYLINKKGDGLGEARIFQTLNDIDDIMNLQNLNIVQGNILLRFNPSTTLLLKNTNLSLRAEELASASQLKGVQHSIKELNVEKGIFKSRDINANLNNIQLAENKSGIVANDLTLTANRLDATASKIKIGTVVLDSIRQGIIIDGISWKKASISLKDLAINLTDKKTRSGKRPYTLRNIEGEQTQLQFRTNQYQSRLGISSIKLEELSRDLNGRPTIKGLALDGNDFFLSGPGMQASVENLKLEDNQVSTVRNVRFQQYQHPDSLFVAIPYLSFQSNFETFLQKNWTFNNLMLTDPMLKATLSGKNVQGKDADNSQIKFQSTSLLLKRPTISLSIIGDKDSATVIHWNGKDENNYVELDNVKSGSDTLFSASGAKLLLSDLEYISPKGVRYATGENKINLHLSHVFLKYPEGNLPPVWSTRVDWLSLKDLNFDNLGKHQANLQIETGSIGNVLIHSNNGKSVEAIISSNPNLQLENVSGRYFSAKNKLYWKGVDLKHGKFNLQSLSLSPTQSLEDYRNKKAFNEDYLELKTGNIRGEGIKFIWDEQDSNFSIQSILADSIRLFSFKDKRQPDTAMYKPMIVQVLKNQKFRMNLDSLRFQNMMVTYWEINKNTDTLGAVYVDNMHGLVTNIKNHTLKENDSLFVVANADIVGKLAATLKISQSYTDTLGFFRMQLNTGAISLTEFNSVLVPLVGLKVRNGNLQALELKVNGNEMDATGKIKMYYQGLGVDLLNLSDVSKQSFKNKLVSRFASAFVIHKNNSGKLYPFFLSRNQNKTQMNYVIKISLEALKTAIGLPGAGKK